MLYFNKSGKLKRIVESVEQMKTFMLQRMLKKLAASKGKTPSSKAMTGGALEFLRIDKDEDGNVSITTTGERTRVWKAAGSSARIADHVFMAKFRNEMRDSMSYYSAGEQVLYFQKDTSADDIVQAAKTVTSTKAEDISSEAASSIAETLKGGILSLRTFSILIRSSGILQRKMDNAKKKEHDWRDKQLFNNALKKQPPYKFDEETENSEVLAYICSASDCSSPSELYSKFVSDEEDEYEGRQTAPDDFDTFRACEQDAISEDKFIEQLVDNVVADLDSEEMTKEELESLVEKEAREIVDRAWENFDYSNHVVHYGYEDYRW